MRLGIDLDNTIVRYDELFHRVAMERRLIPDGTPREKNAVRDYLRRIDREDDWTEMQGTVYGDRMGEAEPFPGVLEFLRSAGAAGIETFIVSHKTRYPARGPRYNLHAAATAWIADTLRDADGNPLVPADRVNLCETKVEKVDRIGVLGCGAFIDDLPEILSAPNFPPGTLRILFAPAGRTDAGRDTVCIERWGDLMDVLVTHGGFGPGA